MIEQNFLEDRGPEKQMMPTGIASMPKQRNEESSDSMLAPESSLDDSRTQEEKKV